MVQFSKKSLIHLLQREFNEVQIISPLLYECEKLHMTPCQFVYYQVNYDVEKFEEVLYNISIDEIFVLFNKLFSYSNLTVPNYFQNVDKYYSALLLMFFTNLQNKQLFIENNLFQVLRDCFNHLSIPITEVQLYEKVMVTDILSKFKSNSSKLLDFLEKLHKRHILVNYLPDNFEQELLDKYETRFKEDKNKYQQLKANEISNIESFKSLKKEIDRLKIYVTILPISSTFLSKLDAIIVNIESVLCIDYMAKQYQPYRLDGSVFTMPNNIGININSNIATYSRNDNGINLKIGDLCDIVFKRTLEEEDKRYDSYN